VQQGQFIAASTADSATSINMGVTFFGKFPFEFIFFVKDEVLRVAFLDTFLMKPVHNSIIHLLRWSGLIHNN
jgi:hypothetical protein